MDLRNHESELEFIIADKDEHAVHASERSNVAEAKNESELIAKLQ